MHSAPQLIPPGELVTVPLPVPALVMVRILNAPLPESATVKASPALVATRSVAFLTPPVAGRKPSLITHCADGAIVVVHALASTVKLAASVPVRLVP